MEAKQIRDLMEAYTSVYLNISESHFKVGDEVVCKASGMEGEIVKVDPEGKGKYYTVKREDGKTMKYAPDELKLDEEEEKGEKEEEGASKEKESEFHDKLDKMVHKTFGKRPEEKKMKEEVELDEDAKYDRNRRRAAQRAEARNEARRRGQTGSVPGVGYVSPRPERSTYTDSAGVVRHHTGARMPKKEDQNESYDLFDIILEHLVAEGYADTNEAALAIMANMSEEWRNDIVEAATDQSDKQIERGIKTTYKAGNVLDNQHQGRSRGLSRLPAGEREAKTKRMRGRLKARRDDLFGERNKREDEARAELKKKYGL